MNAEPDRELFSRLSYISRRRKLELFYKLMNPTEHTRILDVGGEINPDGDRGLQLIDSYPWKAQLSVVNTSKAHIDLIRRSYPQIESVVGDACELPWPDKSFDIVYSNAVIEHVGDFNRQKQMASEIMRVARRHFVTTPNRWYPFEFHLRLPFVTWLPWHGYRWVGGIVSFGHVSGKYVFFIPKKCEELRLLTAREMKTCFPSSRIIKQRVTFMAETLIAVSETVPEQP